MDRQALIEGIVQEAESWPGVQVALHRFGGFEFQLTEAGRPPVEIGHIHLSGMLDIPFTKRLREQLVAENHTGLHHSLPETGWSTFYVRSASDAQAGVWLLRLSYIQKKSVRARRDPNQRAELAMMADALKLSGEVSAALAL